MHNKGKESLKLRWLSWHTAFDLDNLEEMWVNDGYVGQERVTACSHPQSPPGTTHVFW